ncbi:MAG TPA: hypothetical protein EYO73_03460, partial [Sulfurimonas sp.]|nr:hypothetical protein [Sulfurimonas sp.]
MNYTLKLFLLILLFTITACTPKPSKYDDSLYSQEQLQKRKSLNSTYKFLDEMDGIDSAFYLNKLDLTRLINETFHDFTKHLSLLNTPSFSKP